MYKLEATRHEALAVLLRQENPWIDNPTSLSTILSALTVEHAPQKILDMERVYHSCRLEKEVTKETLMILKKIWYNSLSEAVKMKVLSVLDRLLDPMVMRPGESSFEQTYVWLAHLEETLNPYKRYPLSNTLIPI